MSLISIIVDNLRKRSYEEDYKVFQSLLDYYPRARLLDLGCSDGFATKAFAKSIGTDDITGMDVGNLGVSFKFVSGDIEEGLPFEDASFEVVTAYHVLEHLSKTDLFIEEIRRVLTPKGYALLATPNMASGRIIVELLLDKQPGLAHVSDFFVLRGDPGQEWKKSKGYLHRRLFTMEGIVKLLTYHGFKVERKVRAGYGPFLFGKVLGGIYASNLMVKVRR